MDPISVAGMAISAGGIAFQILGGCIKGFVLLSSAHGFGKDSATYICMLNLQELQLIEWAKKAGLLTEPPCLDPRLSESIVFAILRELENLLSDTTKLKSRYKLSYSDVPLSSSGNQAQSDNPDEVTSLFSNAVSNDVRSDIMSRAGVIESNASWPKRIWWAAVDKAKFQELIQNIRSLIVELWRLLDPLRQEDVSQSLQIVLSHVIAMTDSLDKMQALQQALSQNKSLTQDQIEGPALASVAELKLRSMQLSPRREITDNSSIDPKSLIVANDIKKSIHLDVEIDLVTNFAPIKNNENLGTALYKGDPVFIEYKTMASTSKSKLLQRAKDLALLLSTSTDSSFRSLKCCALASNSTNTKVAFIFTLPLSLPNTQLSSPPSLHLTSLRNLFSLSPSITTRISLALKLVQSLRWFHAANWLHKDIRSDHILFRSTPSGSSDLNEPIIAGFAFSRADSPVAISEQPSSDWQRDLYRHPEAMGEPTTAFTKDKDIYALATVLVEIGEWRSLKSILGKLMDTRRYSISLIELSKVKSWLQATALEGLAFRMGEVYSRVVGMMLANEVQEQPREEKGVQLAGVLDTAVRELGKCVI